MSPIPERSAGPQPAGFAFVDPDHGLRIDGQTFPWLVDDVSVTTGPHDVTRLIISIPLLEGATVRRGTMSEATE